MKLAVFLILLSGSLSYALDYQEFNSCKETLKAELSELDQETKRYGEKIFGPLPKGPTTPFAFLQKDIKPSKNCEAFRDKIISMTEIVKKMNDIHAEKGKEGAEKISTLYKSYTSNYKDQ